MRPWQMHPAYSPPHPMLPQAPASSIIADSFLASRCTSGRVRAPRGRRPRRPLAHKMGRGAGRGTGRGGREAWTPASTGTKGGADSVMSMTAFSAMTTVAAASAGRVPSTGAASMRAATAAASDILSSKPATAASSEWIRESRKQRALALAAKLALNPGLFAVCGRCALASSIEPRGDPLQRRCPIMR